MENQKVSIFRQKNKWGMTVLSVIACVILSPALGMTLFLPQALAAVPLLLMALLGYVGPVSAAVCSVVLAALSSLVFGTWGGVLAALLFVPVVVVSALFIEREQPFWYAVAGGGVTMFTCSFAVVALLSLITGSDVVTALSQFIAQALESSGTMGDAMLSMMIQSGLLVAPEGAQMGANGLWAFTPEVREKLVSAIVLLMDSTMRLEIPMQMATASVACGLLGQAVLRKGMLRRGVKVEYPPLRTWRVPKGWGRILGGTLAALFLLANLVPQSMNTMFYVFSGVFDQVFSLQGIAALCYLMHKRGKSRFWQGLVFVLGYFVFGSAAVVLGIGDQAMDFVHRREELDKLENPFDPKRGEM